MSLYSLQKLLFVLNRDRPTQTRFRENLDGLLVEYELSEEERHAVTKPDIGLLYVLGVNGQILMHFAAFCEIAWPDYLEAMRRGIREHGPVRAGIYAMTTSAEEKVAGL
jgi:Aromatic-ring-opening dioxygenase LigAB, LigA subunit